MAIARSSARVAEGNDAMNPVPMVFTLEPPSARSAGTLLARPTSTSKPKC